MCFFNNNELSCHNFPTFQFKSDANTGSLLRDNKDPPRQKRVLICQIPNPARRAQQQTNNLIQPDNQRRYRCSSVGLVEQDFSMTSSPSSPLSDGNSYSPDRTLFPASCGEGTSCQSPITRGTGEAPFVHSPPRTIRAASPTVESQCYRRLLPCRGLFLRVGHRYRRWG